MSIFNNITEDFYKNITEFGSNPLVLVVFILIILGYFILFTFLGGSTDSYYGESNGSFTFFSAILFAVAIMIILVNGLAYFFNIDVITEISNLFTETPEISVKTTTDADINTSDISGVTAVLDEVYHIPGKRFTYNDAKAVCNAFDGELATFNQVKSAQASGASWCSYGWTKDQLGLYPTSQTNWDKLQEKEGHEYDCGLPGVNGGYVANTHTLLGANCYGVKPDKSKLETEYLDDRELYPKTQKEYVFEERVKFWKNRLGNILISPFNNESWFKI